MKRSKKQIESELEVANKKMAAIIKAINDCATGDPKLTDLGINMTGTAAVIEQLKNELA